jgi:hypothetical protein
MHRFDDQFCWQILISSYSQFEDDICLEWCEDPNNGKKPLSFNLGSWDSQNVFSQTLQWLKIYKTLCATNSRHTYNPC